MKQTTLLLCLLSICASNSAQSQDKPSPQLTDFDWQTPLQVSGQNGVVKFPLPLDVYRHAQQADLSDVRLFNAQGAPIPFTFVDEAPGKQVEQRQSDAKLFPVVAAPTPQGGLELDIHAAQDGAVLSVHAKQHGKSSSNGLQAIVLDLGKSTDTLDYLQFALPNSTTTYRAELAIEQSDDLKLWSRVAQSRVDWLQEATQGGSLVNDRIELSPHAGRYLRIQWIDGTPLQFARVIAHWRSVRTSPEETLELKLQSQPGRFPGDWVYAAGPALRAHEIGLDLPTANTVLPVSIGYYRQTPPPKREWQFIAIAQNTFYRLTQNGQERSADRMHIYPQALEQWVVRPATAIDPAPTFVLRIKPRTVVFTAQGGAHAFTLTVGAKRELLRQRSSTETTLALVAPGFSSSEIANLETADLGTLVVTQPAALQVKKTAKDGEINSRSLLLWGVLLVGVVLLAGMSWRLYKQMQLPNPKEPGR